MNLFELAYEHHRDEMVDFNKIDLPYEYSRLNAMLFDNSLPQVSLKWGVSNSAHGKTIYNVKQSYDTNKYVYSKGHYAPVKSYTLIPDSIRVIMSKFLDVPYHVFLNTLAHEMIHVYQATVGAFKDNHGPVFTKEMDRINSLGHGFNVTVKLDTLELGLKMHKDVQAKPVIALLITRDDGPVNMALVMVGAYQKDPYSAIKLFEHFTSVVPKYKKVVVEIYNVSDTRLLNYKWQRNLNTLSYYTNVLGSTEDMIRTDGHKIAGYSIENGKATPF